MIVHLDCLRKLEMYEQGRKKRESNQAKKPVSTLPQKSLLKTAETSLGQKRPRIEYEESKEGVDE